MKKYTACGNSYVVLSPDSISIDSNDVIKICKLHSVDGVLYGPKKILNGDYFIDIYNSDGSKAEISGNGMTIFASHLKKYKYISNSEKKLKLITDGGSAHCEIIDDETIKLTLGACKFLFRDTLSVTETMQKKLQLPNSIEFHALNLQNPHCVVVLDNISDTIAKTLGPIFESDSRFKNKTNVQFVKILNNNSCCAEIWERGSGYTLSSGSSSCAIASLIAMLNNNATATISVNMPGGTIIVNIDNKVCSIINKAIELAI